MLVLVPIPICIVVLTFVVASHFAGRGFGIQIDWQPLTRNHSSGLMTNNLREHPPPFVCSSWDGATVLIGPRLLETHIWQIPVVLHDLKENEECKSTENTEDVVLGFRRLPPFGLSTTTETLRAPSAPPRSVVSSFVARVSA